MSDRAAPATRSLEPLVAHGTANTAVGHGRGSVFIGYKKVDVARVEQIARKLGEALEPHGVEVWWDTKILPGQDFRKVIRGQLEDASVVVVLWSRTSVESRWVIGEASEGARMKKLVPALIDDVSPPLDFWGIQCARLYLDTDAEFNTLVEGILHVLGREQELPRASAGVGWQGKRPSRFLLALFALLGVAIAAGALWRWRASTSAPSAQGGAASSSASTSPEFVAPPLEQADVVLDVTNALPKDRSLVPDLAIVVQAINVQLTRDFAPYWHRSAALHLTGSLAEAAGHKMDDALRGHAAARGVVTLQERGVPGFTRSHDLEQGSPHVVIGIDDVQREGEVWSAALSHEVMEVLADMDNTLQVSGPLPGHPGKTVLFTHEICNPVSAETYPITLSDTSERVEVSNFVYPSYFDPATGEGEQVDFLGTKCGGKMLKPLGVNPRGYLMYKNSASGDWKLLLAREKACVGRTTSRVLP